MKENPCGKGMACHVKPNMNDIVQPLFEPMVLEDEAMVGEILAR